MTWPERDRRIAWHHTNSPLICQPCDFGSRLVLTTFSYNFMTFLNGQRALLNCCSALDLHQEVHVNSIIHVFRNSFRASSSNRLPRLPSTANLGEQEKNVFHGFSHCLTKPTQCSSKDLTMQNENRATPCHHPSNFPWLENHVLPQRSNHVRCSSSSTTDWATAMKRKGTDSKRHSFHSTLRNFSFIEARKTNFLCQERLPWEPTTHLKRLSLGRTHLTARKMWISQNECCHRVWSIITIWSPTTDSEFQ